MAGFLDKQDTVLDVVLTDEGKHQLSSGELEFCFYSFFDDEVDYDPYIANSSSLSETELRAAKNYQIENSLVREASVGYQYQQSRNCIDKINLNRPLFTMPQGNVTLPRASYAPVNASGSIEILQRKQQEVFITRDLDGNIIETVGPVDVGFEKFDSTTYNIDFSIDDFFDESSQKGFLTRVFKSGSDGLVEIHLKKDFIGDHSYGVDIKTFSDDRARALQKRLDSEKHLAAVKKQRK